MADKKNKKQFHMTDWSLNNGKGATISWTTKEALLAYIKDTVNHMEQGKTTKFEVFYSDKLK